MKVEQVGNDLNITIDTEVTAKVFASKKEGWYERQDVKIGDTVYTAQVQIYEKGKK